MVQGISQPTYMQNRSSEEIRGQRREELPGPIYPANLVETMLGSILAERYTCIPERISESGQIWAQAR